MEFSWFVFAQVVASGLTVWFICYVTMGCALDYYRKDSDHYREKYDTARDSFYRACDQRDLAENKIANALACLNLEKDK